MELSLQEMVKKPIHSIPSRYLVDQDAAISYLPGEDSSPVAEIPVLDVKNLFDEENKISQLQKFHSACTEWGIFQV